MKRTILNNEGTNDITMIDFEIRNRHTRKVQFIAKIKCEEKTPYSIKIGLAVKWAIENKANLVGAILYGANLCGANLRGTDLHGADLRGANLYGADLYGTNLYGTNLVGAILCGADLCGANLRGTDLRDTNLVGADLRDAILRDADLCKADLRDANLHGADLCKANLYGARYIQDRVIDGGMRSDGYRFLLTRTEPGEWRIKAGCRNFTVAEAEKHWDAKRPKGQELGDETRVIIKHMLTVAKLRGWPE